MRPLIGRLRVFEGAEITFLVEDRAGAPGLVAEHGLSLWLDLDGRGVLFDTGRSDAFLRNAARLGVDLSRAEAIVLSHGHYDHGGGAEDALRAAPGAILAAHPDVLSTHLKKEKGTCRDIGLPRSALVALRNLGPRFCAVTVPTEIIPGLFATGPVPRLTDFEDVGGPFVKDRQGKYLDDLTDDQSLFFTTAAGLCVVSGCAHAGIVNTLRYAARLAGVEQVDAVIGGMHLLAASRDRLERTLEAMRELDVRLTAPAHCTGSTFENLLASSVHTVQRVVTGSRLVLP